jgi:hypothetical protein
VLDPVIELDHEYSHVEFCNCTGKLDGKYVKLDNDIPVYGFVAFRAFN